MERNRRKSVIAVIAVLAAAFLAFLPSPGNGFTNWDDPAFITENRDILNLSPETVKKFFTTSYGGFAGYVPFVMLTYTVENVLFGLKPRVFHTTNLILHLINCVLVFWFIMLLSRRLPVAFVVSLLFGIHPFRVEAVAWIQGRKDLLFSLFYLAALIAFAKYLENKYMGKGKGRKKYLYFLSLIFFLFSLFSKVAAISLPFALLALDFFISKKIDKASIRDKLPFFALAFLFLVFAFLTIDMGTFEVPEAKIDYLGNIFLLFYSVVFYLFKTVLPMGLSARYPVEISQLASPLFLVLSIGIFAVVCFLLNRFYRVRKNEVTFGILFFLVTLMPTIPFHFVRHPFADRYMYLPLLGLFYLAALYIDDLYYERFRGSKKIKTLLAAGLVVVTLALGTVTWQRCRVWKDSLTLWNNVLEYYPGLSVAYLNRGETYLKMNEMEKAERDLDRALALNPNSADAHSNRGIIYFKRKEYGRALAEYNSVLRADPEHFRTYLNRANVWGRLGRFREAAADYGKALEFKPDFLTAYFYRGFTYRNLGEYGLAIKDFTRMLELDPGDARVLVARARVYRTMGKTESAINDFKESLRIAPDPKVREELLELLKNIATKAPKHEDSQKKF